MTNYHNKNNWKGQKQKNRLRNGKTEDYFYTKEKRQ